MKLHKYIDFIKESNKIKWTKDKCAEEALKYQSRNEFKLNNPNVYNACIRNKWLDDLCLHMGNNKIKNNYWTKEKCSEEALKYKSKSEFEKGSPSAYAKSGKMGWKDEICSHMKTNGNLYKRCIYAIEFPDNNVYIGLTHNYEKRFHQHLNDPNNNSIVLRHFKETGLHPTIKKLTDYIDVEEASKTEQQKVKEYLKNDWKILNIAKCGNVGGKTTKWSKDICKEIALKYETRIDFKNGSYNVYNACRRNNWLNDVCKHMKYKLNKWDLDSCERESKKFKNRDEFKKKSSGAFGYAYNNRLLDRFFPKNNIFESINIEKNLPSYEDCVNLCLEDESCFYETKHIIDGYNISLFNYRLASYRDFLKPFSKEMRGICFIFNEDGSLFKRYVLLEKFFNLNQVPESMYSIVSKYKIKFINNKEDGSIASFVRIPNGKTIGKSKMGFDNEQANGINRVYKTNIDIKRFVDWCLDNDITAIFEYVSSSNRIVLRYLDEELILLRMRDNRTGEHIDIKDHFDKLGSIKIAPFEDDFEDLDNLIETVATQVDKEGCIVTAEDENGKTFFFKLKTPWYMALHGLLTNDIYREHIIIEYILDDKIDDILGQIPEKEFESHLRINKIIKIVKDQIDKKVNEIEESYKVYVSMGENKKEYALAHRKDLNFGYVMSMANGKDPYELAKDWLKDRTKRLLLARSFLKKIDPSLFFKDINEDENQ